MWPQRPHWQWHLANALPQEKGIDRVVLQLAGTDDGRLDVPGQKSKQRNMSTMKKIRAGARRCLGMAFDRGQWPQTGGAHRKACGCPCAHAPLLCLGGAAAQTCKCCRHRLRVRLAVQKELLRTPEAFASFRERARDHRCLRPDASNRSAKS